MFVCLFVVYLFDILSSHTLVTDVLKLKASHGLCECRCEQKAGNSASTKKKSEPILKNVVTANL